MEVEKSTTNETALTEIWKVHCDAENKMAKNFDACWGFLKGPITDFIKDEKDELIDKERPKISDILQQPLKMSESSGRYIKILPSPQPIPVTTSGEIGWRCINRSYWLDRYGRAARPKGNIYKALGWPDEELY
ncbi:unnamed protein product [Calicophoron daubneyi]|uniref:Uncharacterized protein n=1 Tax=Calicophoron daubneyi TaxID=300641 RepID=A0AAV2TJY4_CALDB